MISIQVSSQSISEIKSSGYLFFFSQDNFAIPSNSFIKVLIPEIEKLISHTKFMGKSEEVLTFPVIRNGELVHVIMAGLGTQKSGNHNQESYRRTLGSVVRAAEKHKIDSLVCELPDEKLFNLTAQEMAQQTATTLRIAAYYFDVYISDDSRKVGPLSVTIITSKVGDVQSGVDMGLIIGEAVNKARYWVDLPPSTLTPTELADKAKEVAMETGLKFTVFNEEQIKKMGMGGLAAVSSGSHQDCSLSILEYSCGDVNAPTIAYVGKGITFDSGGLSIKPAMSMETMKEDMSGAAAVITTMKAIAQLKPKINVIGITPLSENLPSGTAAKPGDIVRFYNGKTAEIKNTDAEGRLILADALAYAVKNYKLDAIIDIATLTGACSVALGPFFTGMFSLDEQMISRVSESGKRTGDSVWRLPLTSDYAKGIKSTVADLCNIGASNYRAGATTAACFLQPFVEDTPWVHLDIAGTAFDVPAISYFRTGATGAGVRLLIDIALNWKN